jgi:hypothetical protein
MNCGATMLDASDNVATLLAAVRAGDTVIVRTSSGEELRVVALEAIALCHKIALRDLDVGARVIKYGQCVGETSRPVARGAWVHVHNMRSLRARGESAAVSTADTFDAEAYIDVAANALALPIPPQHRAGVAANLARLAGFAAEVMAFDVPDGVAGHAIDACGDHDVPGTAR